MKEINYLELFGGIGACTQAFKRLPIKSNLLDYVEINKYSVKSFNAMNETNFEPQDITKWDKDLLNVDFIMHGSPCQDFSLAGTQHGGDEGSGTRSSLMYESIRIIQKLQPKVVVWENVENLISDKHIHNFNKYLNTLSEMGYSNYHKVLNSMNYGIPQSRNRVFTVSILGDNNYEFPREQVLTQTYKDFLQDDYINDDVVLNEKELRMVKDFGAPYSFGGFIVKDQICYPTVTASYGKVSGNSGKIPCKEGYRILTPKECWRLLGFSDENYDKASKVNTKNQLYRQAGNSIVVNVLEAILASIYDIHLDKLYKLQPRKLF